MSWLGLDRLGTKSVSVMTFGSRREHVEHCSVVKVGFETRNSTSVVLKLLSVAHICEPIVNSPVDLKLYPQLQSLDFATDLTKCTQINSFTVSNALMRWGVVFCKWQQRINAFGAIFGFKKYQNNRHWHYIIPIDCYTCTLTM